MRRIRMISAAAAAVLFVGDGDVRRSSVECRPNRILSQPQIVLGSSHRCMHEVPLQGGRQTTRESRGDSCHAFITETTHHHVFFHPLRMKTTKEKERARAKYI
ncbi:hypothetical protein C4D60_Mb06t05870 [Musa balbisiana]|uniref:Uncharacterized protein n=1 Tax=Musa balbisiana TaxID=52838 RepID=A0A4S8IKV5_MUSBA|nr:hypothetical protein C4D60_Mb06t05870 [Musa balbisiana]